MRLENRVAGAIKYDTSLLGAANSHSHFDIYKSAYHRAATKHDAFTMLY